MYVTHASTYCHRRLLFCFIQPGGDHTEPSSVIGDGVEEVERNRVCYCLDNAAVQRCSEISLSNEFSVDLGTGLALMVEDVHSIHVEAAEPLLYANL